MAVVALKKPAEPELTVLGIQCAVSQEVFRRDLVCPNTTWTGHEADLLVVRGTKLIEVEIKLSRADLRADPAKAKWWRNPDWHWRIGSIGPPQRLGWPPKIWKHYYVFPEGVLPVDPDKRAALLAELPAASGVYTARGRGDGYLGCYFRVVRRAKANRDARELTAVEALDIARLVGIRYWQRVQRAMDTSDLHAGDALA